MLGKGEMVNRNLMTMFLVASGELFIFIQIFIFRLPRLPHPYKKHEKNHKMDVRIIECLNIHQIVSQFCGLLLLLYYLCLYKALHVVGAQISEEGGRKNRKEGRTQEGEFCKWRIDIKANCKIFILGLTPTVKPPLETSQRQLASSCF